MSQDMGPLVLKLRQPWTNQVGFPRFRLRENLPLELEHVCRRTRSWEQGKSCIPGARTQGWSWTRHLDAMLGLIQE